MVERTDTEMGEVEDSFGLPSDYGDGKWVPGGRGRPPKWWRMLEELRPVVEELNRLQQSGTLGAVLSFAQLREGIERGDGGDSGSLIGGLLGELGFKFDSKIIDKFASQFVEKEFIRIVTLVGGIIAGLTLWWYAEEELEQVPPLLHVIADLVATLSVFIRGMGEFNEGLRKSADVAKEAGKASFSVTLDLLKYGFFGGGW